MIMKLLCLSDGIIHTREHDSKGDMLLLLLLFLSFNVVVECKERNINELRGLGSCVFVS